MKKNMKKKRISIAIALCLVTGTAIAKNSNLTLEQRIELLETRLITTENRAIAAENQVKQLKVQLEQAESPLPMVNQKATEIKSNTTTPINKAPTTLPKLKLATTSDIKIYGDVEFNMDAESKYGLLAMTNDELDKDPTKDSWNLNGRILLGVDGRMQGEDGLFAGFSLQPLADMSGSVNLDDAVFFFGHEQDWQAKIGRFEAYDMFPLNQDTFIGHSGNTANDLYSDGHGYIYMMKEGRGRSDSGGNFLLNKQVNNWYFELNTLIEDGTSLYEKDSYHGRDLEKKKNVIYLRPVVAWQKEALSIAGAIEANVINNAYGYQTEQGAFKDQSDRVGYGLTLTWNGLKNNADNGIVLNANTAYLDANNEQDFTAAINALWHRFELGYIYAHNRISDYSGIICRDDCWIKDRGRYDIHTIHASYQIPNIMNMPNFNLYLGGYFSLLDSDKEANQSDNEHRYGARIRFKYFF